MAGEGKPTQVACRIVGVPESSYYAQKKRPPSARSVRHVWLTDLILQVHMTSRGTYGSRRVHAELTLGRHIGVGREAVAMLMRRAGIVGVVGTPKRKSIANVATSSDLVKRDFARAAPNRLWVTDITEHRTREGKIYCAVVLDTYSRRVVGWSIDSSPDAALVTNALSMAISNRGPSRGGIIHSDHGAQFTSWAFTKRARDSGLVPSMGSIGDCYDCEHDRELLGTHAGRTSQPSEMEYAHRTCQRDLRVPRDLPQPSTPAQLHRNAHADRI
jgi:putative transposase